MSMPTDDPRAALSRRDFAKRLAAAAAVTTVAACAKNDRGSPAKGAPAAPSSRAAPGSATPSGATAPSAPTAVVASAASSDAGPPLSPLAQAQIQVVLARYGQHLDASQRAELPRLVGGWEKLSAALAAFPVTNADEPSPAFRVRRR